MFFQSNLSSGYSPKISGYSLKQIPNFTPDQMQLFQNLLSSVTPGAQQGINYLQKLSSGDNTLFEQLEAPAYSYFNKALGQIGSRFSGFGGRDSSSFENATLGSAEEFSKTLQSQRNQIQMDALEKLLGLSQGLLNQRPYQNLLQEKQPKQGFDWGSISGMLPGILTALL